MSGVEFDESSISPGYEENLPKMVVTEFQVKSNALLAIFSKFKWGDSASEDLLGGPEAPVESSSGVGILDKDIPISITLELEKADAVDFDTQAPIITPNLRANQGNYGDVKLKMIFRMESGFVVTHRVACLMGKGYSDLHSVANEMLNRSHSHKITEMPIENTSDDSGSSMDEYGDDDDEEDLFVNQQSQHHEPGAINWASVFEVRTELFKRIMFGGLDLRADEYILDFSSSSKFSMKAITEVRNPNKYLDGEADVSLMSDSKSSSAVSGSNSEEKNLSSLLLTRTRHSSLSLNLDVFFRYCFRPGNYIQMQLQPLYVSNDFYFFFI